MQTMSHGCCNWVSLQLLQALGQQHAVLPKEKLQWAGHTAHFYSPQLKSLKLEPWVYFILRPLSLACR